MPHVVEVPFTTGNKIWGTYRNYPYKAWYAVAELVDNSTQAYFDNKQALDEVYATEGASLEVSIDFDPNTRELTVFDNGMGMDLDTLKRAVLLAEPPSNTSGRSEFGMGMKTACSWLGTEWAVRTKKLGEANEYSFSINIPAHATSSKDTLGITVKEVGKPEEHYTFVTVKNVRKEFQGTAVSTLKKRLAEIYRRDIEAKVLRLLYKGDELKPVPITPLETEIEVPDGNGTTKKEKRTWKRDVSFDVVLDPETEATAKVTGWISLVVPGGRNKAGFDLLRRGRVVVGRPMGYRPFAIFRDSSNSLINQRLFGELNLDSFPVNHLKSDFQWEGWQADFDDKLKKASDEYADFAKSYRPTQTDGSPAVPPPVLQAANDEVAESIDNEDLAAEIQILETVGPPPLPTETVRDAEADVLRQQPVEPRIVQLRDRTYRIYHPIDMRPEQPYVRFAAPGEDSVDIFINDNHPYVVSLDLASANAERYQEHVRMCVHDAMAASILVNLGEGDSANRFIQVKDQLMRRT